MMVSPSFPENKSNLKPHLLYVMFGHRRHHYLPELPELLLPGLHVEIVAVDPVVEQLRRAPLNVETVVSRTGQVGDQRPGIFFKFH